ncbi:MAG TPA: hypothetical protein VFH31_01705, partial [Pyrinomonadaceae bacterium]|nr:hypothetical protein [Pyrinomonadaceae bacterium]
MTEQAELERDVFRRFAEIAPMAIALESVQNRMPPEPDILCKLQSGKSVAFELVEVCNPKNAKLLFSAHRIVQAIEDAFAKLPEDVQHEFRARFTGHPLSFQFRHEASLNQVRANLPEILTELAAVQERDYEFVDFAPELRRTVVRKVRSAGRQHNPNGMN